MLMRVFLFVSRVIVNASKIQMAFVCECGALSLANLCFCVTRRADNRFTLRRAIGRKAAPPQPPLGRKANRILTGLGALRSRHAALIAAGCRMAVDC